MRRRYPEAIALATLALTGCTAGGGAKPLADLERTLATNDSATAALGEWCAKRGLAEQPRIRALFDRTEVIAASPEVRKSLNVAAQEALGYRHVQLVCGERILSVAHNWYVPGRLTGDMNRTLSSTDTPFGKVVAPLGFRRERRAQKRGPLPQCPKDTILSHEALLRTPESLAISFVIECYTSGNF
ncbi:MAG: hypothetical protein ACO1OX_11110 [Novosphingobium sp.]